MMLKKREILPTPDSLVSNGKFNFGIFSRPFYNLNPLDASSFSFPLPRFVKNQRLKEWQAYEMGNSKFFLFTVLYNAKSIALAQFIIYDRINKKKYLYEKLLPALAISLPSSLDNSSGRYSSKNLSIEYINCISEGFLKIKFHSTGIKGLPVAEAELIGTYDLNRWKPIVVSMPFAINRGVYSHKCLMPMNGSLSINGSESAFDLNDSYMIIDDHKGYYPYNSFYDWVTGIFSDGKGNLSGFNLTHNQVLNSESFNENCLWINGRISLLPPVKFFRPDGSEGEWFIRDDYGMVDISFLPEITGKVDVNLFFLKSYYRGPLGRFSGYIKDSSGNKHRVDNHFGMGEEKRLRM